MDAFYQELSAKYYDTLNNVGRPPTSFILGAEKFLQLKTDLDSMRRYSQDGIVKIEFMGVPVLSLLGGDPAFVGITVDPDIAIHEYTKQELDKHPNGKSGAW